MKNMVGKINTLLYQKELTCFELSRMTGIANTTLSNLLKGRTDKFDIVKLKTICDVLGCSLDYLMNDEIEQLETINDVDILLQKISTVPKDRRDAMIKKLESEVDFFIKNY